MHVHLNESYDLFNLPAKKLITCYTALLLTVRNRRRLEEYIESLLNYVKQAPTNMQ